MKEIKKEDKEKKNKEIKKEQQKEIKKVQPKEKKEETKKVQQKEKKQENKKQDNKVKKKIKKNDSKKEEGTKNTNSKKIKIAIIVILAIVLVASSAYLVYYFYQSNKNKNLYEEVQEEIEYDETTEELKTVNQEFVEKVKELQGENPDVKGWIRIENTNVNYPLVQATDNNYYLKRNYKKEKSSYGSIFINCNSDIKDENANVIIYGHDMRDGQMFKDLLKYQDKTFYDEHPELTIATEEGEAKYEIIFAFKSRIFYEDEKNVFRYYQYYHFKDEKKYNEYINNCRKIQLYDTGKTAIFGEQLVTLITCEYSQENGRMVVVAKKLNS